MERATLIGFLAVIMWSLLALFTDASGIVPPFQLAAMAFCVATMVGVVGNRLTGNAGVRIAIPLLPRLVGIAGLFGYHFLYFTALRNAPAVEASMIAYLWPLLIVVGSALMPGEKLGVHHVAGTLLGLAGTVLLMTGGTGLSFDQRYLFGYSMAALCAITWSSYSLLSRHFARVPTHAVTGACAASAVLSLICHLVLETTNWPGSMVEWLAVAGLGLMPVGAAFYAWDYGVKHGNIQVLGAASYAAPLLSTLVLIAAGFAEARPILLLACLMITAGGFLAGWEMIRSGRKSAKTQP